jgi:ATP-dependent exoDNAse (exonuclease V) beta subunit
MDIQHISVSRKQTFDECPAKYNYRYHQKIVTTEPTPDYLIYGKIVHKVAEYYVKEQGKKDIATIANEVLEGKILLELDKPSPPLPSAYKNKFSKHLKNIKELSDRIGYDGELEYEFIYDFDPPNNCLAKGVIDRLIIRNGKYFILDYKTTKKGFFRKNSNTIRKDLQLRSYGRVLQKLFGAKAEDIRAALYYVEGAELVSTKFTEESLESAEKELVDSYKRIKEMPSEEANGKLGNHCVRCEFKKHCPFYSLT